MSNQQVFFSRIIVESLYKVIKELSHPFQEESTELLTLGTKTVARAAQIVTILHFERQAAFYLLTA